MKIAIIDDSVTDANMLKDYLHQYSEKSGKEFNIDYYEASIGRLCSRSRRLYSFNQN